jgi:Mg/Co/Ni transporter MgtE
LHVTYKNDEQFINDYSIRIENIDNAVKEAREEALRRIKVANEVVEMREIIKKSSEKNIKVLYEMVDEKRFILIFTFYSL